MKPPIDALNGNSPRPLKVPTLIPQGVSPSSARATSRRVQAAAVESEKPPEVAKPTEAQLDTARRLGLTADRTSR